MDTVLFATGETAAFLHLLLLHSLCLCVLCVYFLSLPFSLLLHTGRRAATTDLKLDRVGIQTDVTTSQIPVDDHDATSAPNVFVIGDAALVSGCVAPFVSN